MWNPEPTDMESGIHSVESGIQDSRGLPYMGRIGVEFRFEYKEQSVTGKL